MKARRIATVLLAVVLLALAGCGSDDDGGGEDRVDGDAVRERVRDAGYRFYGAAGSAELPQAVSGPGSGLEESLIVGGKDLALPRPFARDTVSILVYRDDVAAGRTMGVLFDETKPRKQVKNLVYVYNGPPAGSAKLDAVIEATSGG